MITRFYVIEHYFGFRKPKVFFLTHKYSTYICIINVNCNKIEKIMVPFWVKATALRMLAFIHFISKLSHSSWKRSLENVHSKKKYNEVKFAK